MGYKILNFLKFLTRQYHNYSEPPMIKAYGGGTYGYKFYIIKGKL